MTKMWKVQYRLHTSKSSPDSDAYNRFCEAGPFNAYATAEKTLSNVASNPDFRGGKIVEAEVDDD
jgi:hypothetical protein